MIKNLKNTIFILIIAFSGVLLAGCNDAKDYSVQFFVGGKLIETSYVNHGDKIEIFPTIDSESTKVLGWYEMGSGQKVDADSVITRDLILRASTSYQITKTTNDWLSGQTVNQLKEHYQLIIKTTSGVQLSPADIETIAGLGVRSIDLSGAVLEGNHLPDGAFENNTSLESIIFPATLESVGDRVFYKNSNLINVNMTSNTRSFGERVFYDCDSLVSLAFPASTQVIGKKAIANASSLVAVKLGNQLTSISPDFVDGSKKLSILEVAGTNSESKYFSASGMLYQLEVGSIGGSVTQTTKLVRCPEGMSGEINILPRTGVVLERAFADCTKLTKIDLANKESGEESLVYEIQNKAFFGAMGLTEVVLGDTLVRIGESAFENCTSLSKVNFEDATKLQEISAQAFKNAASLTSIEFLSGLEDIGASAFEGCSSLSKIKFNNTASLTIGSYAFYRDVYIHETVISFAGDTIPSIGLSAFGRAMPEITEGAETINPNKVKIFVNDTEDYLTAWSDYNNIEYLLHELT